MNDQDFYDELSDDDFGMTGADDLMSDAMESHELPDLDMLLDTSGMDDTDRDEGLDDLLLEDDAPEAYAEPEIETMSELFEPQTISFDPVFSVLRDSRDDRLAVQMDGAIYRTLAQVPDVKKKFFALIKELSQVINTPDELATAALTIAEAPQRQAKKPVPQPTKKPEPAPPRESKPSKSPTTAKKAGKDEIPGLLPTYNMEDSSVEKRGMFGRKIFEPKPVPELNVGAAIEEFLQYKLEDTSKFTGRNIHVHNVPGGFVRIQVDDKHYEAVSDVEDVEIREFLLATIQEWHEHHNR